MSTEANEVGAEPSLASILDASSDEPREVVRSAAEPVAASEPVKPAADAERPRGSDGKFAAKTEAPPASAQEPTEAQAQPEKRPDWVGPLIAERRRRQAAEQALQTQPAAQPEKPDFFANPERAVDQRVNEGTSALDGKFFRLSLKAARATHTDYDAAGQAFAEAAHRDPRLVDALRNDEDPGELIYAIGTQIRELSDVGGDILAYRGKVTAEAAAKLTGLETQLKAKDTEIETLKRQLSELSTVGRSLNATTSTRPVAAHQVDEDDVRSIVRFGNNPK